VFFASLPIIIYALFDQEFPTSKVMDIVNTDVSELEINPVHYSLG